MKHGQGIVNFTLGFRVHFCLAAIFSPKSCKLCILYVGFNTNCKVWAMFINSVMPHVGIMEHKASILKWQNLRGTKTVLSVVLVYLLNWALRSHCKRLFFIPNSMTSSYILFRNAVNFCVSSSLYILSVFTGTKHSLIKKILKL